MGSCKQQMISAVFFVSQNPSTFHLHGKKLCVISMPNISCMFDSWLMTLLLILPEKRHTMYNGCSRSRDFLLNIDDDFPIINLNINQSLSTKQTHPTAKHKEKTIKSKSLPNINVITCISVVTAVHKSSCIDYNLLYLGKSPRYILVSPFDLRLKSFTQSSLGWR